MSTALTPVTLMKPWTRRGRPSCSRHVMSACVEALNEATPGGGVTSFSGSAELDSKLSAGQRLRSIS